MILWHHYSSLGIGYARVAGARVVRRMLFRIHPRAVMSLFLELFGSVASRLPQSRLTGSSAGGTICGGASTFLDRGLDLRKKIDPSQPIPTTKGGLHPQLRQLPHGSCAVEHFKRDIRWFTLAFAHWERLGPGRKSHIVDLTPELDTRTRILWSYAYPWLCGDNPFEEQKERAPQVHMLE